MGSERIQGVTYSPVVKGIDWEPAPFAVGMNPRPLVVIAGTVLRRRHRSAETERQEL
jgi:hypothetical protein